MNCEMSGEVMDVKCDVDDGPTGSDQKDLYPSEPSTKFFLCLHALKYCLCHVGIRSIVIDNTKDCIVLFKMPTIHS